MNKKIIGILILTLFISNISSIMNTVGTDCSTFNNILEWQMEVVDSEGDVGLYCDLVVDDFGWKHISYYDKTNGDLKYAVWDMESWNIEVVDSIGDVGLYTSIDLDKSEDPHITYYDNTNNDLKMASWSSLETSWTVQTVDSLGDVGWSTSLGIDENDRPHISYYDFTNNKLKYATLGFYGWDIIFRGDGGLYNSLDLTSDNRPYIAYTGSTGGVMFTWFCDEHGWDSMLVDNSGEGWDISLAVDESDGAHITYYNDGYLRYAVSYGDPFNIENVDHVTYGGWGSSIDTYNGKAYVSYYKYDYKDLWYKWMDEGIKTSLDVEGDVGQHSSLFKWADHPHISYYDATNGDLKIVYQELPQKYHFEKLVSDDEGQTWKDEIDATVCTNVRFKIDFHNNIESDWPVIILKIRDTLPECLDYKGECTVTVNGESKEPDVDVDGNRLTWDLNEELAVCEHVIIEFKAHVKSGGINDNKASFSLQTDNGPIGDTAKATVNAQITWLDFEKLVSNDKGKSWNKECKAIIGKNVSFKISIHNKDPDPKKRSITIKEVTDLLPKCLEYIKGTATVNGEKKDPWKYEWSREITWWINKKLEFCETLIIQYNTTVVSGGKNINRVTVSMDGPTGEKISTFDTATVTPNNPPKKPKKPSGKTDGKTGTKHNYITSTTDPDGEDVYYWFDWGDGTNSGWLGPEKSGDNFEASHVWIQKGNYDIKVKAKDVNQDESEWSDPLEVTMPKSKVITTLFLQRLIQRFPILNKILNQIL